MKGTLVVSLTFILEIEIVAPYLRLSLCLLLNLDCHSVPAVITFIVPGIHE